MKNMQKQKGFTLIELIVVIVILGVLAATALPKFINVTSDANIAAVKGMAGGIRSAASLVQARFMASGMTTAGNVAMAGGGGNVAATANGWPTAAALGAAGIAAALQSTDGFTLTNPTATTVKFALSSKTTCYVTYDETTGAVDSTTQALNSTNC